MRLAETHPSPTDPIRHDPIALAQKGGNLRATRTVPFPIMLEQSPSRLVYSGPILRIGEFRCPRQHSAWACENFTYKHFIAFPRVGVWIAQENYEGVIADPNVAMFYNGNTTYRRRAVSERGDECEYFSIDESLIIDAIAEFDPTVRDHPETPFPFDHGPIDSQSYLLQRRIYSHARAADPDRANHLALEEAFVTVLRRIVAAAFASRGVRRVQPSLRVEKNHTAAAEAVKELFSTRAHERLTLDEISDAVECSPFHLCRVFRARTGLPIHRYLNRLRLRNALEQLAAGDTSLTRLSDQLGFSSHGHFTSAFTREFGAPPSAVRNALTSSLAPKRTDAEQD